MTTPTTSNHIQPPTDVTGGYTTVTTADRIRQSFEAAAIKLRAIPRASLAAKETTSPSTADQISGLKISQDEIGTQN